MRGRARKGGPTGGVAFGFTIETDSDGAKSIAIDPERAPIVRRIFALYAAGPSLAKVAATLNVEGVPAPRPHSRRSGDG